MSVWKKLFESLNGQLSDIQHICVILFDQYFDLMENITPQIIGQFPQNVKAYSSDLRSTTLSEAMSGPRS